MDVEFLNQSTEHITLARTFTTDRATKGFFTTIYASPSWQSCRNLWDDLIRFKNAHCNSRTPWLLISDFNCILGPYEKHGGLSKGSARALQDFQNFFTNVKL